jgi:putative endonuclease
MNYFVYIVRCSDNSLYTGITTNIERRINEHNGLLPGGAKYTLSRNPVLLVYSESFENRSLASKEEYRIKKMTLIQKIEYISKNNNP